MEQLRSDKTDEAEYVQLELEADSDEAGEQDSCQEVTCEEEVDGLAGEEEQVEFIYIVLVINHYLPGRFFTGGSGAASF